MRLADDEPWGPPLAFDRAQPRLRSRVAGIVHRSALFAACAGLVLIACLILTQMLSRLIGVAAQSIDEFAAYALVATTFLGLGPTYRASAHIRVSFVLDRLQGVARVVAVLVATAVSAAVAGWATFWIGRLVLDSWSFGEVSQGLVPVPLWLPQSAMLLGVGVFALALLEDLGSLMRRGARAPLVVAEAKPIPRLSE